MPKDVQDRMSFDGQAAAFFAYIIEKAGIEKMKGMVQASREGKDLREMLQRPEYFGSDMEKIEADWQAWVKAQKPEPAGIRVVARPQGTTNE